MAFYGTLEGADDYLAAIPAWLGLSDAEKESSLTEATLWLDDQDWRGRATDREQTLCWPRKGLKTKTGAYADPAVVPTNIVNAGYELAYQNTIAPLFADVVTKDFSNSDTPAGGVIQDTVTAGRGGGVEVTKRYAANRSSTLSKTDKVEREYPKVNALISHYLIGGGNSNRMVRF